MRNAAAGDGHEPAAGQGAGVVVGGDDGEPEPEKAGFGL